MQDRIKEAEILWRAGRKEGAWIMALIAADATSAKRYPNERTHRARFTKFIRDMFATVMGRYGMTITYEGNYIITGKKIEDVIYEEMRCNLIHEGELREDQTQFSESKVENGKVIWSIHAGPPRRIPEVWIHALLDAVREAPENAKGFRNPAPKNEVKGPNKKAELERKRKERKNREREQKKKKRRDR